MNWVREAIKKDCRKSEKLTIGGGGGECQKNYWIISDEKHTTVAT